MKHLLTLCLIMGLVAHQASALQLDTVVAFPYENSFDMELHITPGTGGMITYRVTEFYGSPSDIKIDTFMIDATDTLIVVDIIGLCDAVMHTIQFTITGNDGGAPQFGYASLYTLAAVGESPPEVLSPIQLLSNEDGGVTFRSPVSTEGSTNTTATIWIQYRNGVWDRLDWSATQWIIALAPPTVPCESHVPHDFEWGIYDLTADTFATFVEYENPIGITYSDTVWFSVTDGIIRRSGTPDSIGTSIAEVHNQPIKLYPNPTTEVIQFGDLPVDFLSIRVYDLSGRMVIATSHTSASVATLTGGIYVAEVLTTNGEIISRQKFIKQ